MERREVELVLSHRSHVLRVKAKRTQDISQPENEKSIWREGIEGVLVSQNRSPLEITEQQPLGIQPTQKTLFLMASQRFTWQEVLLFGWNCQGSSLLPCERSFLRNKGTTEKLRLKEWEKRDIFLKLIWKLVQKCLIYPWIASFRSKQIPWCA